MEERPNPFKHMGEWYWRDAEEQIHGPFQHQRDALFNLLRAAYPEWKPDAPRALYSGIVNGLLIELPILMGLATFIWWLVGK